MKKRIFGIVMLACVSLAIFSGCSMGKSESFDTSSGQSEKGMIESAKENTNDSPKEYKKEVNPEEKLVYQGYMALETLEYEKAIAEFQSYIKELGGFFESTDFSDNSGYDRHNGSYINGSRFANFKIRIPSENFHEIMNKVGDWGIVTNKKSSVENITVQYNDAVLRLESLQIQHDNLLELMKKATTTADMITIEKQLSEVRFEINSIKSHIGSMDLDVSFSTINLEIREVRQYSDIKNDNLITRMSKSFVNGIKSYWHFVEDFIVYITENILFILTYVLIIFVTIKTINKKRKTKKEKNQIIAEEFKKSNIDKDTK